MPESPFDDLVSPPEKDLAYLQKQQASWEERVVKLLIKERKEPKILEDIVSASRATLGEVKITFDAFRKVCPNFPLYLVCRKIPNLHTVTIEKLFKNPQRNKIVKAFINADDEVPNSDLGIPYGLVFEWLHSGGPMKIIHNRGHYDNRSKLYISIPLPSHGGCCIENLTDFLLTTKWAK